jgi:hypothetical protein
MKPRERLRALRAFLKKAESYRPYRLLRVLVNRPLGPRGKRYLGVLLAGLIAIVGWQAAFGSGRAKIENTYRIVASSGVHYDRNFVYLLYYLDLFPAVSTANSNCTSDTQGGCWDTAGTPAPYNYDAAKDFLTKRGNTVQMDLGWTWNAGDRGKIYLYLFDAWLKGAPWNPTPTPAAKLAFIAALCALWASCWYLRRPVIGVFLIVLMGSNPFQLYEVHAHANVFGWTLIVAILLLAIHLPLLERQVLARIDRNALFVWPVGVGILMATARTIRSETVPMLLAAIGTYALIHGLSKKRRLAMIVVLGGAFFLTGQLWNWHFIRLQNRTTQVVASVGGHPFPPEALRLYHHGWHPVWCGLGDFDTKYGYVWNDHNAAAWAKPKLEEMGIYVPSGFFISGGDPREYYDADKIYKKLPYEIPEYTILIRDKIIHDVTHDPLWYLDILKKRAVRIFEVTTPVRLSWPTGFINIPWKAWFTIPLVLFLFITRSRFWGLISLFTFPTLTTAFVIFSDLGTTYYGTYHHVACAVVGTMLTSHAMYWGLRAYRKQQQKTRTAAAADSKKVEDNNPKPEGEPEETKET